MLRSWFADHSTAIAIQGKDCVVFAVENIVTSKLYEPGCVKRIYNIDDHIGMSLTERLAMYMHAHTLYSAVRPFGVSVLLGSYENDGPHLFVIEPSGLSFAYFGCAIGKAKQNATTEIEKLKMNDLSPEELIKEAAKILDTKGIHQPVPRKLFDEAETFAKQALEEADDLDDEVE
ncbi:unnamed protein product [Schistosoma margrebowiei]|uniref:Uncharacterized protein n=1 Tax=Schistosoma margrebowiei TaxID=48269 RepID=A0A183LI59_9TREM|nr:unnamed protein product [Schistosoma margrebowiei]